VCSFATLLMRRLSFAMKFLSIEQRLRRPEHAFETLTACVDQPIKAGALEESMPIGKSKIFRKARALLEVQSHQKPG
jgi:hypothetical protein